MIGAGDPLHHPPRRILIAGVTGAGKSTLAEKLSLLLGIPYIELDALYHGPNWSRRENFLADVDALAAADGWITEWQYASARARLEKRADTVVWLDYPAPVVLTRLIRRTVRRRLTHEVLWSGNVEPPLWHLVTGRDHVIAWALATHRRYRGTVPALATPELQVVRLGSQADADAWLATFATTPR